MFDQVLDGYDLTFLHTLLTLVGFFLALYLMQLTSTEHEDVEDPVWLRWARRANLLFIALVMLWSLSYSMDKQWQPWPPEVALIVAIVAMMAVRVVAIHARIAREGHRPAKAELSRQKIV